MRHQGETRSEISHTPRLACAVGQVVEMVSSKQLRHLPIGEYAVVLGIGSRTRISVGKRSVIWLEYPVMVQRLS